MNPPDVPTCECGHPQFAHIARRRACRIYECLCDTFMSVEPPRSEAIALPPARALGAPAPVLRDAAAGLGLWVLVWGVAAAVGSML